MVTALTDPRMQNYTHLTFFDCSGMLPENLSLRTLHLTALLWCHHRGAVLFLRVVFCSLLGNTKCVKQRFGVLGGQSPEARFRPGTEETCCVAPPYLGLSDNFNLHPWTVNYRGKHRLAAAGKISKIDRLVSPRQSTAVRRLFTSKQAAACRRN